MWAFDHVACRWARYIVYSTTQEQVVFFNLDINNVSIKWRLHVRSFVTTTERGKINFGNEIKFPEHAVDSDEGEIVVIDASRSAPEASPNRSTPPPFSGDHKSSSGKSPSNLFIKLRLQERDNQTQHQSKSKLNVAAVSDMSEYELFRQSIERHCARLKQQH
jgi:hypothetical protein